MEQYKVQNVTYEQDIPILQETVGGVWKKEKELKALKAEVAALERKIQLELAPSKPEAAQEQQDGIRATMDVLSDALNQSQFLREHVQFVRSQPVEAISGKGIKI